jgi:hypothetical protein
MPRRTKEGRQTFDHFVQLAHGRIGGVPGWLPLLQDFATALAPAFAPIDDAAIFQQLD